MANPSSRWDWVPVYGVWLNFDDTPTQGRVTFSLPQRVQRVDGRIIFAAGASITKTIGDPTDQDAAVRATVRDRWRAIDQAKPGFNGPAWDNWWTTIILPGAIFTSFPAVDDPDIVHDPDKPWSVIVSEQLPASTGRRYAITPLLADLDLQPPGINLGAIEVPPGSPAPTAPAFMKGVPGGVASLGPDGKVPSAQLPATGGGITLPAGVGLDVSMPYAAAATLSARPVAAGIRLRIFGGTSSDPTPTWMIAGDYRQYAGGGGGGTTPNTFTNLFEEVF